MSQINQKPIPLKEEETVFAIADKAIGDSLEDGNFDAAFEAISTYRSLSRASELSVSKVLHGVNHYWHHVEHEEGEDFFIWSLRATGYNTRTVERHIGVWEMLSGHYIPEQYRAPIKTHTVRQLFKMYSLVVVPQKKEFCYDYMEQDYWIEDKDWLALSEATDEQRVAEVVNKIKDRPRNKNFMSLKIDDMGRLYVLQGDKVHQCGQLFTKSPFEAVQKAVSRICDRSGITQKDVY